MDTKPRILIVDDERLNINVLADLLKPDYKIMAAISGEQALKAARGASPPDLVLLDIMMPEMDGYEVCRLLKEDPVTRDIPVIFVTAMEQDENETRGLELGAVDYITKPITGAIVEARVRTHVALRRSMLELRQAYDVIETQSQRMQGELDVGRDIQIGMLPKPLRSARNRDAFAVHGSMKAAREVGGDFYDFFFVGEDQFAVCIGDVSGKGVPAALFMAVSKALIKSRASEDPSPASILTHVNGAIAKDNDACMFVTVFLAILDLPTGELRFSNAGHNPPYIRRSGGRVETLNNRHGPVIGALEGITYGEDRVAMTRDDLLLLFTDGVTEAMNTEDQLFSESTMEDILDTLTQSDPEAAINAVMQSVDTFTKGAEQSDDITLLGLSFLQDGIPGKPPSLRLVISNKLEEIGPLVERFKMFAESNNLSAKTAQHVMLCLDEMLNNTISYGFDDDESHTIEVAVDLVPDRKLTVTFVDDGIPFNPLQMKAPNVSAPLDERDAGGLGIHLVRKVMDNVAYKRRVDKNELTLVKLLD